MSREGTSTPPTGTASRDRPTLLVLRALGLGDLLTAVPALRGLRAAFPGHQLTMVTNAWLEPVVRLIGVADELVPCSSLDPPLVDPPSGATTTRAAALAVNLHGRGPASHQLLLAQRPKALLAFEHPARRRERPGTSLAP